LAEAQRFADAAGRSVATKAPTLESTMRLTAAASPIDPHPPRDSARLKSTMSWVCASATQAASTAPPRRAALA
jgi:hypothetical protein